MKKKAKIISDKTKGSASASSALKVNELKDQEVQDKETTPPALKNETVAQFFIFQGENCLGWECFDKETVTAGKGKDVDIVLNGQNVSDLHAFFYLKNGQITVSDGNLGSGVRVNGKFIADRLLGPLDCVTIGPYTIKVKVKKVKEIDDPVKPKDFERPKGGTKTADPVMNTPQEDEKTAPESKEICPEVLNEASSELKPESANDYKVIGPPVENHMKETLSAAEETDDEQGSAIEVLDEDIFAEDAPADEVFSEEMPENDNDYKAISPDAESHVIEIPQEAAEADDQQESVIESLREEAAGKDALAGEKTEGTDDTVAEFMSDLQDSNTDAADKDDEFTADKDHEFTSDKNVESINADNVIEIEQTAGQEGVLESTSMETPAENIMNYSEESDDEQGSVIESLDEDIFAEDAPADEVSSEERPENDKDYNDSLIESEIDVPPKLVNDWLDDDQEDKMDQEDKVESDASFQGPHTDTADKEIEDAVAEFISEPENDSLIESEIDVPPKLVNDWLDDQEDKVDHQDKVDQEDKMESGACFQGLNTDTADKDDEFTVDKDDEFTPGKNVELINADNVIEQEQTAGQERVLEGTCPETPAENIMNYSEESDDEQGSALEALNEDVFAEDALASGEMQDAVPEFRSDENEIPQAEEKPEVELTEIIDQISALEKLGSEAPVEQETLPDKPGEESCDEVNPDRREYPGIRLEEIDNQTSSGEEPNFEPEPEPGPGPGLEPELGPGLEPGPEPELGPEPEPSHLYAREHSLPPETEPGQVSGNNKRQIEENDHTEELFSLEEKLINDNQMKANPNVNELVIEVVKCRGSEVLDIRFLRKRQKYYHINEHGRFCLAENKGSQKCYFFFHDQLQGRIRFSDKTSHDIAELCTEENLYHKKKKIYRCQLPAGGLVFVNDGIQRFYLQVTTPVQSPYIPEPVPKKKSLFKSLLHLGLLLLFI